MNLAWFMCFAYVLLEKIRYMKCLQDQSSQSANEEYISSMRLLLSKILSVSQVERCFMIMTDDWHEDIYDKHFFQNPRQTLAYFYIKVKDSEDLMAPNYQTVRVLKRIKTFNCDLHLITLVNGLQVKRLLVFLEKYRILNTKQKFILIQDDRLITQDMLHIWSSLISTVFINPLNDSRFRILSIAFPNTLTGMVVTKRLITWAKGKHLKISNLFSDTSLNLIGLWLPVAVFQHVPMVVRNGNKYSGLEIKIVRALAKVMNFQPVFYESIDAEIERWGRQLHNGSYTGIIGQVASNSTAMAIGDIHVFTAYSDVLDFSTPHSYECLTFLAPESSQDKSWKTFIQPFSGNMWTGVLLSLLLVGSVFYVLSLLHNALIRQRSFKFQSLKMFKLLRQRQSAVHEFNLYFRDVRFRRYLNEMVVRKKNEDLFDSFSNCILLTFSMLMYVSLPRVPRNWPLRVLTGWYWLYCILITVSYRASFTAILANPVSRITIDTLEELLQSRLTLAVGSEENKKLFDNAFDGILKELGKKTEIININGLTEKISKGGYAYYDNQYFLQHLRLVSSEMSGNADVLHIMRDCVVKMPVALALSRNSPLKPHIDKYLQMLMESGLLKKWLHDTLSHFPNDEPMPTEAIIDLHKFWSSFVPLILGYLCGILAVIMEQLYHHKIVMQHPLYDKHNTKLYYNFKRKFVNK